MKAVKENLLRAPAFAALALGCASFGDAFLYPFLPLHHGAVGIPVVWVGLLLSINRFVRIISNAMVVHAFAKYGLRTMMLLAVVVAIVSTLGYGMVKGVAIWLCFRVMWGLAFSTLRLGALGYALQHGRIGLALGMSKSLQEAGPMFALLMTPLLLSHFESTTIFYALAVLSIPALYFAWALPEVDYKMQAHETGIFFRWPSILNSITFISAILIDGIVVVVIGVLFLRYNHVNPMMATTLAAFFIGYRRVCLVIISPAGGWLADRMGFDRVFNVSMVFTITGLVLMITGWMVTGIVILFISYSIHAAVTPGSVFGTSKHSLVALAVNATWRDIGAAVGTVAGGFLITSPHLHLVLVVTILILTCFLLAHFGISQRTRKQFFVWK